MATYYMGADGKFREKKLESGTYTMNEDGTFSLKKEPEAMATEPVAGVKPTVLPSSPATANTARNDFAAKAGRHQMPVAPVKDGALHQLGIKNAKQTQQQADIAKGTSAETRLYDKVIGQIEPDLNRYSELQMFYDDYQINPDSFAGRAGVAEALEEFKQLNKKYGSFADAYETVENLKAEREKLVQQNHMKNDLAVFATWDKEDQDALYRGLQAYADNEMVLVGSIERKLYDKYGKDAVERIWESVAQKQGREKLEAAAKAGQEEPGLGNTLVSMPVGWLGSILTIPYRIAQTIEGGTGRYGVNAYAPFSEVNEWAKNVQAATKEEVGNWVRAHTDGSEKAKDLAEGISEFAFGAGVQIVDNLAKVALFRKYSLALAATSGFEEGYRQAADSGADGGAALALGVAKGALEVLTEKIPLDNLLDNVKAGKSGVQAVIEALAQGGIEATTEELNFVGGLVAEAAILRDKSGYQQIVKQAMAQGMNYAQAREYATQQLYLMAAETAATAFVAGAGSSGITSIATNMDPSNAIAQQAQDRQNGETAESQAVGNGQLGTQEPAQKSYVSMEEYANSKSPVWRNVEYADDQTKNTITQQTHEQMVSSGSVVTVTENVLEDVDQSLPDLRGMKKSERTPILKDAVKRLKENLRQFLSGFSGQGFEFEVNGKVLEAKLYSTGINEVLEKVTKQKANMLYTTEDIFRNARYLYSTQDYDGDPNVYRWNYFYTPVQIGDETVGVRIAVRDMATPKESQIYNWSIKKEAPLDGVGRGADDRISHDVSSGASNNSIRENVPVVNTGNGSKAAQGGRLTVDDLLDEIMPDGKKHPAQAVQAAERQEVNTSEEELSALPETEYDDAYKYRDHLLEQEQKGKQTPEANESVGAAPSGFDPLSHLQYEYGTIPEGEKAVRDDSLPVSTDGKDRVSYTARSAMGAKATTDAFAGLIGRETVKGGFSFIPINNSDTVERAKAEIKEKGWEDARKDWEVAARTGKSSPELTAIGAILYNNAVNSGAYKTALEILTDYSMMVRNSAQALQAARILKTLTPENRLYMIARTVEKFDEAVNRTKPARRRTDQDNIPVEQWMQKTGEKLAKALSEKVTKKSAEADTVAKTVLKDLRRIANETVTGVPNDGAERSEMDMIRDLVMNRKQYEEALAAAKETVRSAYGENADVMQALETWMETSLRPDAMFAKELMGNSDDVEKISIPEGLISSYMNAETDEARDEILDEIAESVASQIPPTFMDGATALRYMNMLGNLRTQVRNVAGNVGMKLLSSAQNATAAGIEALASKATGGKLKRTKSFSVSKEQMDAARDDFDGVKDVILDGGKFNDADISDDFTRRVEKAKKRFKGDNIVSKGLEGYRKAIDWAMEQGDLIFAKDAYARALAGYLKANGVTETDYSKVDPALMDEARLYAIQKAQEQTFRDTNWLSGWVSKIGRRKDTPAVGKLISEGIMPFRKTPANVLIRAEEYSPLGVLNSIVTSVLKIAGNTKLTERRGLIGRIARGGQEITGTQIIESWSKSLTGTGVFALGMLLKSLGVLVGGPDEDEKKEDFEELSGYQNYALQFGDESYTIDWLTPAAMPLLMGAELWELMQDGGIELKDLEQSLLSVADPMIKMSMLQGIDDTLKNISYADSNWGQLAVNAALSYLTQGLTNTALGQIERAFEDSRTTTYVDKDSAVPAWLQRAIGKASAKIPGWDYNQVPYINAWGEEEENPQWAAGLAYNMLSPGYYEKGVSDDVYNELVRLDAAQGDVNVYPASPDKTITIDKQKRNLSAEQWVSLAKTQGQTARGIVEDIISSKYYSGLSDDEKAKAIRYAYDYAREHARVKTIDGYDEYDAKWMKSISGNEAEAILRKVATGEKGDVDTFAGLSIDKAAMLSEVIDELFDKPREVKPDGTSYTSVRTIQKVEAVVGSSLTEKEQQTAMEDILDDEAYKKYLKILDAGYDNDDYAESYRIVLDAEKTKTKSKKEVAIRELMQEMDLTKRQATTIYEIYNPPKSD